MTNSNIGEVTTPVAEISQEAVEAALNANRRFYFTSGYGSNNSLEHDAMLAALTAALPHLSPPAAPGSMDDLQQEIGSWAKATFDHTDAGIVAHFGEEAGELVDAFRTSDGVQAEAADCAILLLDLADEQGWSLEEAVRAKYAINRTRQWGKKNDDGVVHHVGRDESAAPSSPAEFDSRPMSDVWVVFEDDPQYWSHPIAICASPGAADDFLNRWRQHPDMEYRIERHDVLSHPPMAEAVAQFRASKGSAE